MKTLIHLSFVILATACLHASPEGSKPNIIFILTDDQGYGDLSCYGSEDIATPNIDRLATEGMKFESFYVHNRCSPTRAAFMTGSHAGRTGLDNVVYRWEGNGISDEEITVAELLKDSGYATGMIGKWHLGSWERFNPVNHGFDSFYGFFYEDDETKGIFQNLEMVEKIGSQTDGIHSPKLLQAGIDFIKAHQDEPFFLYYASPLPHTKWIPHPDFVGSSKQGTYGDVSQEIDWQVGGLLDTLDELGLADNTLVIFASDNGPQLNVEGHGSAGRLRDGKWTNFEGGIRVPCLMRWPGKIPAGSTNNEITGIIDMLPTFCALSGAEVPADRIIDGKNILPYLLGEQVESPIHDRFVVPGSAIRLGDWKLLVKGQNPGGSGTKGKQGREPAEAGSLFNLKDDLGETTNVAAQHPEVVQQLQKEMKAFMEEYEANVRPIGWVEGYSEERVIETKRGMQGEKAAKKEDKKEKSAKKSEAVTEKPVHLFILSGQSNMAGMDPETGFMTEANKLFQDEKVVYIKVAKGGQPICRWLKEWEAIAAEAGLDENHRKRIHKGGKVEFYQPILDQFQEMSKKHPKFASITFCWMQGERDANGGADAAYKQSLKQLIANLRRDLKRPDMNIVIGRIGDYALDRPSCVAVRKAQREIVDEDAHGAWVDVDDLNDREVDGKMVSAVHFNRPEGYVILGERFARQGHALIKGEEPAENGRP
ncbi:MAG: sulfatase-like hydrolase/transferase [Verrucomicrobiota bacterium]